MLPFLSFHILFLLPLTTALSPLAASSQSSLPRIRAATSQTCTMFSDEPLNCFEGPSLDFDATATLDGGHSYTCSCQVKGQNLNGNSAWDFIPDRQLAGGGCYVNQYYTTSPCVNSTLPVCTTPAS